MKKFLYLALFIAPTLFAQRADPLLFAEKIHDFGEIDESLGKVEFEFNFTNNTARPIRILSVEASCGCTTTGYTKDEIKQGKSGFVKASFDPKGRPGYFNKTINIATDYSGESIVLQIKGQVNSGAEKDPLAELTFKSGNLRFKHSSFSFSKVFINREPIEKEFAVFNAGEKPIRVIGKLASPDYLSITLPEVIQSKQKAFIKIKYDGKKRNQYGFYTDAIEWQTDDELQPVKSFPVYATMEEFFVPLAEADKSKAPALQLDQTTISIGRIVESKEIQKEATLKNIGKKELFIRSLQPNCTCIQASVSKNSLKPGEEAKITITYSPLGRIGPQNKSITIYSNDPQNPVQRVMITGYIPN